MKYILYICSKYIKYYKYTKFLLTLNVKRTKTFFEKIYEIFPSITVIGYLSVGALATYIRVKFELDRH